MASVPPSPNVRPSMAGSVFTIRNADSQRRAATRSVRRAVCHGKHRAIATAQRNSGNNGTVINGGVTIRCSHFFFFPVILRHKRVAGSAQECQCAGRCAVCGAAGIGMQVYAKKARSMPHDSSRYAVVWRQKAMYVGVWQVRKVRKAKQIVREEEPHATGRTGGEGVGGATGCANETCHGVVVGPALVR